MGGAAGAPAAIATQGARLMRAFGSVRSNAAGSILIPANIPIIWRDYWKAEKIMPAFTLRSDFDATILASLRKGAAFLSARRMENLGDDKRHIRDGNCVQRASIRPIRR